MQFIVIFEVFRFVFSPSVHFMFLSLVIISAGCGGIFLGLVYVDNLGRIVE